MDGQTSNIMLQVADALPVRLGLDMAFAKCGDMCSMGPCAPLPIEERALSFNVRVRYALAARTAWHGHNSREGE